MSNLTRPEIYRTRVNTLKDRLPAMLADYVMYYVLYNSDTTVNENKNYYDTIVSNLTTLNSDLFKVQNDVEKGIEDISTLLTDNYDPLIETEKTKNLDFKKKLGIVENEQSGSNEMINDFKNMYNLQYLNNFAMFGGLIALLSLLFKPNKTSSV